MPWLQCNLEDVLAPHILDWIHNEDFDEVTIPDEVLEAILNGVKVQVEVTVSA